MERGIMKFRDSGAVTAGDGESQEEGLLTGVAS